MESTSSRLMGCLASEVGGAHIGVSLDRVGCTFGDLAAVEQDGDAIGEAENHVHVVLDDDDGETGRDAPQETHGIGSFGRAHARGRLVEQQDLRLRRQGQPDLEPPFFAIGELGGRHIEAVPQLHRRSGFLDAGVDRRVARDRAEHEGVELAVSARQHRNPQVVAHRQAREDLVDLEALGDAALADQGCAEAGDVLALELDRSGARRNDVREHVEEGRLARAVGPDDGADLAFAELERDVVDRSQAAVALGEVAGRNLTKRYGGLTAVDDVSFELREGEIRAVIGPNGAGKATCFNILANVIPPSSGTIEFKGEDITGLGATLVCQRGISKSFQINQIFPSLTVRDNLRIPVLARAYGKFHPFMLRAVTRDAAVNAGIEEAASSVQLRDRLDVPAAELAYGEKRRLEIGLALATQPQILLLDEPTAGMSPAERTDTVRLLRRIAAGLTIVIVEHDMDVVFGLADRITVLFNGRKIAEGAPDAIQGNPDVRAAYLGSQAAHEPA